MNASRVFVRTSVVLAFIGASPFAFAQVTGTALVRHGPTMNGPVDGSVRQMLGEDAKVNSGGSVTGDLLVPGTPTVVPAGTLTYGGTVDGTGSTSPSGYKVTLGSGISLRHVIRRTDPVSLATVATPPIPSGTIDVTVSSPSQIVDFATLRNLTLSNGVGEFAVPPGTYGKFTANGATFVLGVAGATQPALYNLQQLTLNSASQLLVVGPVVVTVAGNVVLAGPAGSSSRLDWLQLRVATGDVTLNNNGGFYGYATAPAGTVVLNSTSQFVGGSVSNDLTVGANSLLRLVEPNTPPTVSLTSPAPSTLFSAPANILLQAGASDADGSVAKVEFFAGATKLGEAVAPPFQFAWSSVVAGSYSLKAVATDDDGAIAESTPVAIVVNTLPAVSLTAPVAGASYVAPAMIALAATASDNDGTIAKVEFFSGPTNLGVATAAPYQYNWSNVPIGGYALTAVATDNRGGVTSSNSVSIQVYSPNVPPAVALTSPANGAVVTANTGFTLTAGATDSDGTITKVEFFQGATKLGEATSPSTPPSTYTFSMPAGLPPGAYTFTARATDDDSATATSAAVSIIVNAPPTVALISPANDALVVAPATVTLTANASDSDGSITKVEFFQGATKLGEAATAPYQFTVSGLTSGSYSFNARATDDRGAVVTSATVNVRVNSSPTVTLTTPADNTMVATGTAVTLSANAGDSDGTIAKVEFCDGDRLLGTVTAATTPPSTFAASFDFTTSGTHTLTARTTDNLGTVTTSAPVTLIVNAPPTGVVITSPANGAVFTAPASFSVIADAADSDGTVERVEFFRDGTKIGDVLLAPYLWAVSGLQSGAYVFTVKATDNRGLTTTSAPVSITVNLLPTVAINAPANNAVVPALTSVTLVATAADTGGTIAKVEFFSGSTKLGEGTAGGTDSYSLTLPGGLSAGSYSVTARATDNLGGVTTSPAITLIVNTAPIAGVPQVTTAEDTAVAITLTATDADGDALTYTVTKQPDHGTLSGTVPNLMYTPVANYNGPDNFKFKARDTANVDSNEATVTILVTPVDDPPVVNAGADQSITLPAYASLAGVVTEVEGQAVTLTWSRVSGPGTIEFEHPNAASTRASFSAAGEYTLRLTASDGSLSGADDVVVMVNSSNLAFRTYTTSADFALGVNSNINTAVADQLQLNANASAGHVLWVANSSKGTVVKINTRTGRVEGEYRTAPEGQPLNPSRTTVDLRGGVWCSNRDGNAVVHIGSVESGLWIDKNGNGQPDTSVGLGDLRGWSNAGGADTNGGVSMAEDECIIHYVRVSSAGTRHLSVDRDNNVWVSGIAGAAARTFNLLDGRTGAILRTEGPVGHGGYGGLLDRNGTIWSTSSGTLLQWDTSRALGGPAGYSWALGDGAGDRYGLALAPDGYVWCSTIGAGLVHKYAPSGQLVASYNQGNIDAQGVAIDRRGHVWLAHTRTESTVGHLRPDGTFVGKVTVGSGPTGVSVDADGKIWSTNNNDGTVSRIDPDAGPIGADGVTHVGAVDFTSVPLGGELYNYSDMTGSNLIASPLTGVWTVTFDSGKTGTAWGSINWHALIFDDSALSITVCSSADGVTFSPWRVGIRGVDLDVPDGRYLKINVLMQRSTTGQSPIVYDLTVGEQGYLLEYPFNQPPVIEAPAVQAANFGVEAKLQAKVSDDGLPHPAHLAYTWTKVSGPGTVAFDSATRADATATFSQTGNYVLRLTATDGATTTTRDVTVVANTPPTAFAGPDLGARVAGATLAFRGSVFEDTNNNGGLQVQWQQLAGPTSASIANVALPTSAVTLPALGRYLFELKADDGLAPPSTDTMQIRVGPLASPDLPNDMAAWWTFDGTTADVVNGHIAQLRNGATLANGYVAQAAIFNGVTSHAVAPAHADFDIGTSPAGFSIEFWMKPDEFRDASMVEWESILCVWQLGGGRGLHVNLPDTAGGTRHIDVADVLQTGVWQHIAVTYDQALGVARIYRNGSALLEQTVGTFIPRTTGGLYFGHRPNDNRYFKGGLDEVTLYRRPLATAEIGAIYEAGAVGKIAAGGNTAPVANAGADLVLPGTTATLPGVVTDDGLPSAAALSVAWETVSQPPGGSVTFANPAAANTGVTFGVPGTYLLRLSGDDSVWSARSDLLEVRAGAAAVEPPADIAIWWPANGHVRDLIKGNHDLELVNGTGFAPGRVLLGLGFDGVDDFARTPEHADLNIGTGASGMTIEFWMKPDEFRDASLVEWSTSVLCVWQLYSGRGIHVNLPDTGGGSRTVDVPNILEANLWQHIAVVYQKTVGIARVYRNGVQVWQQTVGTFTPRTIGSVHLGHRPGDSRYFKGTLDEVSLYGRALSATEIAALYAAGSDGKCPPDDNLPPIVTAGADVAITGVGTPATLSGVVTDDGKPFGAPVVTWTKVAGPGAVAFGNGNAAATTATFTAAGTYLLKLTASDRLTVPVEDFVEVRVAAAPAALPADAAAWWPANNHPHEVVKGDHDIELLAGTSYVAGRVLQGLGFDGVNDIGRVPTHPDLDIGAGATGMSIEFWMNPDEYRDASMIEWGGSVLCVWQLYSGRGIHVNLPDTGGGSRTVDVGNILEAGAWQHIAVVYDRSAGVATIYRNGAVAQSQTVGTFTPRTVGDVYFGNRPGDGRYFKGRLDEITFYTRPLTATEVAAIYNAGADGKAPVSANNTPAAFAGPDVSGFVGVAIALTGSATDDGLPNPPATLTYQWSKVSGPGGAVFSAATAPATLVTLDAAGSYMLRLTVSDSAKTASDDVVVTTTMPPSAPPTVAITSPASNTTLAAGTAFALTATATDSDGTVAKVEFFRDGTLLGQDTTAPFVFNIAGGLPVGNYAFTAKATDNAGLTAISAAIGIDVIADPGDPFAAIGIPAEDARITQPTVVTGVAATRLLSSWSLQRRLKAADGASPEAWTTFASGTTAVGTSEPPAPGTLGTLDPTLLINGIYELRLTVTDTSGRTAIDGPITVVVEGNMKVGAFSLAFEDLKVPVAGIPISITRTYDSRDSRVGDFGPGWRLALNNIRVQKNRHLGTGWWQTPQQGTGLQFYYVEPVTERIVTVVMPDGQTHRFRAGALVKVREGDPDNASFAVVVTHGKYRFYPLGDTTSKLEPLNASNELTEDFWIGGTGDQDLRAGDPASDPFVPNFNTTRYRLTTSDGNVFVLDEALGLLEMRDLDGNTLVLNRDGQNRVAGVTSTQTAPSGPIARNVTIHRDATGRVDYIRDLAGKDLDYIYDAQGRFESFTNREMNVTQFRYENAAFPHYLTKIIDPRGVTALRSEYDAGGKLIKQIDADGKETIFTHGMDAPTRFEKVKDRLGNETTFYYDDRGNVTLKIDPLGAQTSYNYWPDSDRVKFEIDHYGNVKSFAYDARGNVTVQTIGASTSEDPANPTTGYTTRTSYNAQSAPTQITDPDGRTQTFSYEPITNNLLTHTLGAGGSSPATTTYTYRSDGTLNTITDALGNGSSPIIVGEVRGHRSERG